MALCVRKGGTTLRQKWCVLSLDMALLVSMTLVVHVHVIVVARLHQYMAFVAGVLMYFRGCAQGLCSTYRINAVHTG